MSDYHAKQLEKYLREVEGGLDVLYFRTLELSPSSEQEKVTVRWDPRSGPQHEKEGAAPTYGFIRRGSGFLPPDFWHLPRPEDPTGSVRRAVEEDRR